MEVIQQWEGCVHGVGVDCFEATLVDITDTSMPDEFAEILISTIKPSDRVRIKAGAIFDWIIYKEGVTGRVTNEITFRDWPRWTASDIEYINDDYGWIDTILRDSEG